MKHPTKQQMQSVIETLEKAVEMADGNCPVDMRKCTIYRDHPCGSPMCFAGWYGLVKSEGDFYGEGVVDIVKDLGFIDDGELIVWASYNPHIWGNIYGCHMFTFDRAFTGDPDIEVPNLQYIINHLKGVKERLQE